MPYFNVTLLDDSVTKDSAIIKYKINDDGQTYQFFVSSQNEKLKNSVESVLQVQAYTLMPLGVYQNTTLDGALEIYPYTLAYLEILPEIFGWRGYRAEFEKNDDVTKSFDDFDDELIYKSEDSTYMTAQGVQMIRRVPAGMIAINSETGKVLTGGKLLNVPVDSDVWSLVPNPHAAQTPEQRNDDMADVWLGFKDYHAGMDEEQYSHEEEHTPKQGYKPKENEKIPLKEYAQTLPLQEKPIEVRSRVKGSRLPQSIEQNKIIYNPETGAIFDSKFYPPTEISNWENHDWYVFSNDNLTDDDKEAEEMMFGKNHNTVRGIDKGVVYLAEKLNIDGATRLTLTGEPSKNQVLSSLQINKAREEVFSLEDLDDNDYVNTVAATRETLKSYKEMTTPRLVDGVMQLDEAMLDKLKVPNLKGVEHNLVFEPRGYQKPVIMSLIDTSVYERLPNGKKGGGARGEHGQFLNLSYGAGKTMCVIAADTALRNTGTFVSGKQSTVVTCPVKNTVTWQTEVAKFRGEGAIVVDGTFEQRKAIWEDLLDKAEQNKMPSFVVVASSKFSYELKDGIDKGAATDDDYNLRLDAQYMKLLALGGKSGTKTVAGNHVSAMVMDESAQYINPESGRHEAANDVVDAVYNGNGLVWTLNGDISANSAGDTVSESSLINAYARSNRDTIVKQYTIADPSSRGSRRLWANARGFMAKFGHQIYSLNGKTIAGDKYGLKYDDDASVPLGKDWGGVYVDASDKLILALSTPDESTKARAIGMLSILINASFGATAPARLLEYGLGTDSFKTGLDVAEERGKITKQEKIELIGGIAKFLRKVTTSSPELGTVPVGKMQISSRNEAYAECLTGKQMSLLESIVSEWKNPFAEHIISKISNDISTHKSTGEPLKVGISGFSRRAMEILHTRLIDKYGTKALIQIVSGGVNAQKVNDIQENHRNETERPVISIVTSAGLYGLSLPSQKAYSLPAWNHAKGGQYVGRFHRSPEQPCQAQIVVPTGLAQYMRQLQETKAGIAQDAYDALADASDDDLDDMNLGSIDMSQISSLVDKVRHYKPQILAT